MSKKRRSRQEAWAAEKDFASYAWRLIGTFRTQAGWLDLTTGRLGYTSETRGEEFDVRLDEVKDVVWPWYYFGGGVKLTVNGEQYRLSFVLPNGAEYPTARMAAAADPGSLAVVLQKGNDIAAGRDAGKEWRRRLEGAGSAAAPPLTPPG